MGRAREGSSVARPGPGSGAGSPERGARPSAAAPQSAPADPVGEFIARLQGIEAALAPAAADTRGDALVDVARVLADALSDAMEREALARMRSQLLTGEQLDHMSAAFVDVYMKIGELRAKLTAREG